MNDNQKPEGTALADRQGVWVLPLEERAILAAAGVYQIREVWKETGVQDEDATVAAVEAWIDSANDENWIMFNTVALLAFQTFYLRQGL